MSKRPSNVSPTKLPTIAVTGTFFTVVKESHLLYEALEIEIVDGVVVSVTSLNRAPDLSQVAIGNCQRRLWKVAMEQDKSTVIL
jgi:hypothetical protein